MNDMAVIQGHGGIGVVEAVGPEVRRVQVGDRVCVSGTPHCGVVLPLPARPLGHVPVPERDRRRRSRRDRRSAATARPFTRTRTSAAWPS